MRYVNLGSVEGQAPASALARIAHKTRHLRDRMEEFLPDGMLVQSGVQPAGWGFVKILVPGKDSRAAAAFLQQRHGIASCPPESDGMLLFLVTDRVSFEDMDYVQGAVTELFFAVI